MDDTRSIDVARSGVPENRANSGQTQQFRTSIQTELVVIFIRGRYPQLDRDETLVP
jgi:hypothetical protein